MNKHLIWGVILMLTGIGVFFRIPTVIAKVKAIEMFSGNGIYIAYFSFYFMGTVLIGGGIKKIHYHIKKLNKNTSNLSN